MATQGRELGKAYIQIIPTTKGARGAIAKGLGGEGKETGLSIGGRIAKFAKVAVVGAAIGKFVADSFKAGAELQQNLGGTEAVFGQFAKSIQSTAKDAYKNMGLSASDYMATANKMGSLFQGSGLSQQRSLDLTTQAMQRAADVASVMGIDTTAAMESIAGAAKGNFTMMDNLGVAMNATTLEAYALEKGINFKWNTASQAEKAELAMQMFMDRTSQYGGNFAKESSTTFSGSLAAIKASYQDFLGSLMTGGDVTGAVGALAESIKTFLVGSFIPGLVNILSALPGALVTIIPALLPALVTGIYQLVINLGSEVVKGAPVFYESAMELIAGLKEGIKTSLPGLLDGGVEMISSVASGMLENLPKVISGMFDILSGIIETIYAAMPSILEAGGKLLIKLALGLVQNIPHIVLAIGKGLLQLVVTIAKQWPMLIEAGLNLMGKMAQGLGRGIPALVGKIPGIVRGIINAFKGINWGEVGRSVIQGIANGIRNGIGMILNAAKDAAKGALNAAKKALGINSPSRVFRDQVGSAIPEGISLGISENQGLVRDSLAELTGLAENNIEAGLAMKIRDGYVPEGKGRESRLLEKIEALLSMLAEGRKTETSVIVKDREVARVLKEMGVVFA